MGDAVDLALVWLRGRRFLNRSGVLPPRCSRRNPRPLNVIGCFDLDAVIVIFVV